MIKQVFIDPKQWSSWMTKLGRDFMPAMLIGIRSGAEKCKSVMHRRTADAPPASPRGKIGAMGATGHYRMAWKSEALPNGARVFNQMPYAGIIEQGRRTGFVGKQGITNLQTWARTKFHLTQDEALDAAFAIARTLSPPPWGKGRRLLDRNVMGAGISEMTQVVMREITLELSRVMR